MTEQERVDAINNQSVTVLYKYLQLLDEDPSYTEEQLLSEVYGGLVVLEMLGFRTTNMAEDAVAGANRLKAFIEKQEAKQK